jgi:hypothetical protein
LIEPKGSEKSWPERSVVNSGGLPGVFKILLTDFQVALPTGWLVYYLNERKGSPLTKLQREMSATVVNGLVGGAP